MLLSYIIPYYNSSDRIDITINSILSQTLDLDYEILIINDCSDQENTKYLEKFSSERFIVLSTDVNSGPGVARNIGLDFARGDYVICIDADDYIEYNLLEKIYPLMVNKVDLITFNYYLQSTGDLKKNQSHYIKKHTDGDVQLDNGIIFSKNAPWGKAIKKSVIRDHNIYFADYRTGEDYQFTKSVFACSKEIVHIDVPLYNYVMHSDSIMHSNLHLNLDEILKSIDYISKKIKLHEEKIDIVEALYVKEVLYGYILTLIHKKEHFEFNDLINDERYATSKCFDNKFVVDFPFHMRFFLYFVRKKDKKALNLIFSLKKVIQSVLGMR